MRHLFTLTLLLFSTVLVTAQSQKNFTLSGVLRDADSREPLVGASILLKGTTSGTTTDENGAFKLMLPSEEVIVQFSYIGYQTIEQSFKLRKDDKFNVNLVAGEMLQEVEVSATSNKEVLRNTQMSVENISGKEAKLLPAFLGEVDIIRTLQLKPGIKPGGEGTTGLIVRGGSPDQNLFLLDGAQVYNPSHLFGFFSTFNSDIVDGVQLYKGGFPSQYGGRLSSVVDVNLTDGNNERWEVTGGLGLISSRLTVNAPIVKEKASLMVSGRRTYVDIFTRMINKGQADNPDFNPIPDYAFHDINAKLSYDLSPKDKLFVTGYFGRDAFKFSGNSFKINFDWGNTMGVARWYHEYNSKKYLNTLAYVTDYNYEISNQFGNIGTFRLGSGIRDYTAKSELTVLTDKMTWKYGGQYSYHVFDVNRLNIGSSDGSFNFNAGKGLDAHQMGVWVNNEWDINPALKVNTGLRVSGFYNKKFYTGIEPRFSARYAVNDKISLKANYTHMYQYIHLVSNSAASLPTDLWYPSTNTVRPQAADQVGLGINIDLPGGFLLSDEVYYKWSHRQIDFKDGANLFVNNNLDGEFVFGKGWAYGNEFYIEKKTGNLTGWVGYTFSYAWRQFDAINQGRAFHPRFDTRHDITAVVLYKLNRRWNLTATWIYTTGAPTTLPYGRFSLQDVGGNDPLFVVPVYTDRNAYRMPAYHRLDIGAVWRFYPKWGESDLTFSVYNAYNRRNPYFISIDSNPSDSEDPNSLPTGFQARLVSLFPVIPSVTWNFKF